jgi:GNAT superfamily N-acetyltransferase
MAVRFRRLRLADKRVVASIGRRTWGGWDYVERLFDHWVREPEFLGVEHRGRLVGFGKATELAPGHWWLEGLRVDPHYRGRGFATGLSRFIRESVLARRPRSLRLATGDVNHESMRVIERSGFQLFFRTRLYRNRPGRPTGDDSSVVRVGAAEALRYMAGTQELAANRGLLSHTWSFRPLTGEYMRELAAAGAVFGHRVRGRLDGLMLLRPNRIRPRDLELSYVGGSPGAQSAFRARLCRVADERGAEAVSGMAATGGMRSAFGLLGLKRHRHVRETLVYDYPV